MLGTEERGGGQRKEKAIPSSSGRRFCCVARVGRPGKKRACLFAQATNKEPSRNLAPAPADRILPPSPTRRAPTRRGRSTRGRWPSGASFTRGPWRIAALVGPNTELSASPLALPLSFILVIYARACFWHCPPGGSDPGGFRTSGNAGCWRCVERYTAEGATIPARVLTLLGRMPSAGGAPCRSARWTVVWYVAAAPSDVWLWTHREVPVDEADAPTTSIPTAVGLPRKPEPSAGMCGLGCCRRPAEAKAAWECG